MKTETLSILTFLISLLTYGFMGFIWVLYDSIYSLSGLTPAESSLVFASKIQTIVFISVLGAFFTALAIYVIERRK